MRGKRFLLAVLLCSPFCLSQEKKLLEIFSFNICFRRGETMAKKKMNDWGQK
jgi:hypothetical protein